MLLFPSLPTKFSGEGDALFVMFEEAGLCHGIIKEEAAIWFEGWAEFVLQDGRQAGITGALNADG
eukprot:12570684-Ditylum_brightwellii.AAC.1